MASPDTDLPWSSIFRGVDISNSLAETLFQDSNMTIRRSRHASKSPKLQRDSSTPGETIFTPSSFDDALTVDRTNRSDELDFVLYSPVSAPQSFAGISRPASLTPSATLSWNTMDLYEDNNTPEFEFLPYSEVYSQLSQTQDQQQHISSYHSQQAPHLTYGQVQQQYTPSFYPQSGVSPGTAAPTIGSWANTQPHHGWYQDQAPQHTQTERHLQQRIIHQQGQPQLRHQYDNEQPQIIYPEWHQHQPSPHRAQQNADGQQIRIASKPVPSSTQSPLATQPLILLRDTQTVVDTKAKTRRGGRKPDSKLNRETKEQASAMRKTGACWRCAFQRDSCRSTGSPGHPCVRCERADEESSFYIPCDRSKLPDFIHDFLPATMTYSYQKQIIEDCVVDEVREWIPQNSFEVALTTGWGVDLRWTLFEFVPNSQRALTQVQCFPTEDGLHLEHIVKYSPPFGIMKLDSNNYFDQYLNGLFQRRHLQEFSEVYYASESRFERFPEELLDSLCNLIETKNDELKNLVKKVIRMMMLTYIMTRTLTIVPSTLEFALQHVRHTSKPAGVETQEFTSPKLANRQLKFYFCQMKRAIFDELLRWGQRTLHASAAKDDTWLLMFCSMLGFGMVLEEIQSNLQIQAVSKVQQREHDWDEAQREAIMACQRIDEKFDLLCRLFRYKYRSVNWTTGTFGERTPQQTDAVEIQFLQRLRGLVETKVEYLKERRDVPLGHEHQCKYTSRLVARFLLPFLDK